MDGGALQGSGVDLGVFLRLGIIFAICLGAGIGVWFAVIGAHRRIQSMPLRLALLVGVGCLLALGIILAAFAGVIGQN
jgi:hypothetical protein